MHHIHQKRRGFTVQELMIVIAIMGLLVAFSFGAFNAAVAHSRTSRTKVIIAKLDQIVMERWESYRTRPVPIRSAGGTDPRTAALNRLNALRELMRMEMPNTIADVNDAPAVLPARPALNRAHQRRAGAGWSPAWQHAECLYLIVASMRDHDKSALDFFTKDEIGDLDGDGVPEILDGWGNPIQFVRWPVGYVSDPGPNPASDGHAAVTMQNRTTPDSFDPLKADTRAASGGTYDLKPLIFSLGPDKVDNPIGINLPTSGYSSTTPPNDPFFSTSVSSRPGAIPDSQSAAAAADNITNHYQEAE